MILMLCSGTHGLFEELHGYRHAKGNGSDECPNVGLVRSQLSMFFRNVHHMIPGDYFLDFLKKSFLWIL